MPKLLPFLLFLAHIGLAQTAKLDSLTRQLTYLSQQPTGYVTDTLRAQTLKAMTRAYVDENIDSAAHYNDLLLDLSERVNLPQMLLFAYQQAGYLNQVRGDYHQSIRYQYKALALAEKHHDFSRVASSYGRLANSYTSLKDFGKAVVMCERGRAVLRQHPDPSVELSILNALGGIYRDQHRPNEALVVNRQEYELARRIHDDWFEAQGLHTIGWDYMELGDLTKPLGYYEQALVIARRIGRTDLQNSILLHIAELYRLRGNLTKAVAYCQQVKQTANQLKNSSIVAEADEKLYQTYKQMGRPAQALAAFEEFVTLRDSLSKEKTQHRIESLQAQYDNVQKTNALQREKLVSQQQERRNEQLARTQLGLLIGAGTLLLVAGLFFWNMRRVEAQNRKIEQQRALLETARTQLAEANATLETRVQERTEALTQANQELTRKNEEIKAALFRGQTIERKRVALELHDNLSSLLSAVNMSMAAIDPQHLSDSEQQVYRNLKHMVQNAYAEVRNISHNILPAELEKEGLVPTLTTLIARLNQTGRLRFSLLVSDLPHRLPVQIEFNVYSIVLELINNAIKHAQATTVSIELAGTSEGIRLTVADDGIGLGTQETKRGVGLQNIQARLDGLGGTFQVLPAEKGTQVQIEIPTELVDSVGI
jgi:two-component system, NarL family, sensor histidine kinase LiaS